jgi:hypothetical protein
MIFKLVNFQNGINKNNGRKDSGKELEWLLIKEIAVQREKRYRWPKRSGQGEQSSRKYAQLW